MVALSCFVSASRKPSGVLIWLPLSGAEFPVCAELGFLFIVIPPKGVTGHGRLVVSQIRKPPVHAADSKVLFFKQQTPFK